MRSKAFLDKIRKKAIARTKALALCRKVISSGIITRGWNVHASDDGLHVFVSAPVRELNALRKAWGLKNKVERRYKMTVCEPAEFWGHIRLEVR